MKLVIHKRGLKSNTEHDQFIANENKKAKQYIEKEYGGGLGKNKHYLTSSNNNNNSLVCTTIIAKKKNGSREKRVVLKRTKRKGGKSRTHKKSIKFVIPSRKKQQEQLEKRKKVLKEINKLNRKELSNVLESHKLLKSNSTAPTHVLQTIAKHAF